MESIRGRERAVLPIYVFVYCIVVLCNERENERER